MRSRPSMPIRDRRMVSAEKAGVDVAPRMITSIIASTATTSKYTFAGAKDA